MSVLLSMQIEFSNCCENISDRQGDNMKNNDQIEQAKMFWNRVARDWDIQVGDEGDSNRILNSDPVLWKFAGNVEGLAVLDAGCGTGYLSRKLHKKGAKVIGVDFSSKMIEVARSKAQAIDFRVDSCSDLRTVPDASVDLVIANYVLMDTPDLEGAMKSFNRVLKTGGFVIAVFSHPCFPQGQARASVNEGSMQYNWSFPYFDQKQCIDPPWGHFKSEFIWFHRPLSDYFKAFKAAGFSLVDFEEPRVTEARQHLAESASKLKNSKLRPYSVAFKLQKV